MMKLRRQLGEQGRCVGFGGIAGPQGRMHLINLHLAEVVRTEIVVPLGDRSNRRLGEHISGAHMPQRVLAERMNLMPRRTGVGINRSRGEGIARNVARAHRQRRNRSCGDREIDRCRRAPRTSGRNRGRAVSGSWLNRIQAAQATVRIKGRGGAAEWHHPRNWLRTVHRLGMNAPNRRCCERITAGCWK